MDNYPKKFAPKLDEGGGVVTPFDQWWPQTQNHFSNVPEEVAKEWLHRHWGHSPYGWLPSDLCSFSLEDLPSAELGNVLNRIHRFEVGGAKALDHGRFLCGEHPKRPWHFEPIWLSVYMKEHGKFPSPIIVLDNRDGILSKTKSIPEREQNLPHGLILIEGHQRHQIGMYLQSVDRLKDSVQMYRITLKPPESQERRDDCGADEA